MRSGVVSTTAQRKLPTSSGSGNELDDFVSRLGFAGTLEAWDAISCELFSLATVYDFDTASVDDAGAEGALLRLPPPLNTTALP